MTIELINKGIDAVKNINDSIARWSDKGFDSREGTMIVNNDLNVLADILQACFIDMVKADNIKEQLKSINKTLDEHLSKFQ